jgi:predicted nucleic acid-binding protein
VKGVDAGVLADLLGGARVVRPLLKHLRGVEVATTELSLLELGVQARRASARSRSARQAALDRLRRKLTVLPIDARSVVEATRRANGSDHGDDLLRLAEWGALEAYGCDELFTRSRRAPKGVWRFKVTILRG